MTDSRAEARTGGEEPETPCCSREWAAIEDYCKLKGCPLAKGEDLSIQMNNT